MRKLVLGSLLLLTSATALYAQNFTTSPCPSGDGNSGGGWFFGHQEHACELRRTVLPVSGGQVMVKTANGGIEVVGEDRRDIALEAKVEAQGSSHEEAESILHEVRVLTDGSIHADGPHTAGWGHGGWSVSFRLRVPRRLNAQVQTENGGISLRGLNGNIRAETTNGGLSLAALTGDVHAETVNGAISLALGGDEWHGAGLSAKTVNGSIAVHAPGNLSGHLIANTVNGAISVGFPITVQGRIGHNLDTTLGQGGPPLHFETVNGSITLSRGGGDEQREE